MEVANDAWASLLPDILLDIFRRLEATAIVRCTGACKPWRRAIIGNASSLRPCPDRFNPNLLVGFFHHTPFDDGVVDARSRSPPDIVSVTALDTGHCERLSSLIPAASKGGVDLSSTRGIISSCDGLLLLLLRRRGSKQDELCLCNTMSWDYTFLPLASIDEHCEYTLLSSYDFSPPGTSRDERGAVRILARAGSVALCTEDDRLIYQVLPCGDDGAGTWGPVHRSDPVDNGLKMNTHGRNGVVAHDAVHWLAGPKLSGRRITCTVGLDINTGRGWAMELPSQCQSCYSRTTRLQLALTTSCNGRLSLLQPLGDHDIHVWVLDGDVVDAMEWSVQHKISIGVQNNLGVSMISTQYWNVVCSRSGFVFVMSSFSSMVLRSNLDRRVRNPGQCISMERLYDYYPYEMDWSTYISNMKNF